MRGSILWKAILSALILVWAVTSLMPTKSTPFDDYVLERNTAQQAEFKELYERAVDLSRKDEDVPSVFVGLKTIANSERIDLAPYFPDIHMNDIKNLEKRNNAILNFVLKQSLSSLRPGLDLQGGVAFTFALEDEGLAEDEYLRQEQLAKAVDVIRDRVDSLGVSEPVIRLKGDNMIEVQLAGVTTKDNPEAADILKAPAVLEFHVVHPTVFPPAAAPAGYVAKVEENVDKQTGEIYRTPLYIRQLPAMKGNLLKNAGVSIDEMGAPVVSLEFTSEGGREFARVTGEIAEEGRRSGTVGRLAIVLDGEVVSAPTVRESILGGRAQISGSFTQREAAELANVLNNPLEVGLQVAEMSEVGPSFAKDARDSSIKAATIGAGLVIAFMLLYYMGAGVIAVISVIINIVIILGALASLGATITLPGVAALVLTVGMAVDGNILIFERIREELKVGKSIKVALQAGYEKAFSTIMDANITTLLTALILIYLGSGPVKGFGVTLAIGIVSSIFCVLIVSRFMLEIVVEGGFAKRLIPSFFKKELAIPFLSYAKPAYATAAVILVVGVVAFIMHFDRAFGIDFRGGDEVGLTFEQRVPAQEIIDFAESTLIVNEDGEETSVGAVNAIYQTALGQDVDKLVVQTELGKGNAFAEKLIQQFPDAGLSVESMTQVGGSVGKDIQRSAIISVAVALIGILLYISVRFETGYGIGALVSTIHDLITTVCIFFFLGEFFNIGSGQFTSAMVAAILMILGYSINDTIVTFDRIREELQLHPGKTLREVVNFAINRTMSRTILTSLTTFLATLALYLFGAGIIVDFALVFLIGIITGTFSSVFIACPVFYRWHKGERRNVEEKHDALPTYEWESGGKVE